MTKIKYFYAVSFLLLVLNICLVCCNYVHKTGFHVDELLSYGPANSTSGPFLFEGISTDFTAEEMRKANNRWFLGKLLQNYLTVQEGERFHYANIIHNLAGDVHPPLFYMLLHTVSSFHPNTFSKWQGAAVNIPLWILLLVVMYKLSGKFFENKYLALIPVVFYAFSEVGLNTVLYIRGYMLQTLLATCLIYEIMTFYTNEKINKKNIFMIFLFSFLGIFTHYNSLIFSGIIWMVMSVVLLLRRNKTKWYMLSLAFLFSVLAAVILFPQGIHVLSDRTLSHVVQSRWTEGLKIIQDIILWKFDWKNSNTYITKLWSFCDNHNLICLIVLVECLVYKYLYTKADKKIDIILCVSVLMYLYCGISMPQMFIYDMRYVMLVMPCLAIVTIWYLNFISESLIKRPKIVMMLLGLIVVMNSLAVDYNHRSPFAFQRTDNLKNEVSGRKVLLQVPAPIMLYECIEELKDAEYVYWTYDSENEDNILAEMNHADYLIKVNTDARYDLSIQPVGQFVLAEKIAARTEHVKTIKIGERFYDLYRVKATEGT